MKDTLILFGVMVVGFGCGWLMNHYGLAMEYDMVTITLYFLLFFIGLSLGADSKTIRAIKQLSAYDALLPVFTVIGTLIGAVLVFPLVRETVSLKNVFAISSGFGYYSLSAVMIHDFAGAVPSTIGLFSNVFREVLTIVMAPVLFKWFNGYALVSAGGATSMDVTLPVITKFGGKHLTIISVYHGFVISIIVPILITFIYSFK